jgi:hypothetical protein
MRGGMDRGAARLMRAATVFAMGRLRVMCDSVF